MLEKEMFQRILEKHRPAMDALLNEITAFKKNQKYTVESIQSHEMREAAKKLIRCPR